MPEKLYTARDIMKALPVVITLWYKPFKELKAMYRAGGGPNMGNHINKRDCILFIAFGESDATRQPDRITALESELRETKLQLSTANAGAAAARRDLAATEKVRDMYHRERSDAQEDREHLIATFRLLAKL